ncbi:MAG: mechanosensitive ion channel [archaeon]|nr:mechanosensitive ion channel [archaeon]
MEEEVGVTLFAGLDKIYSSLAQALPTLIFVGAALLGAYIAIYIIQRIVKRVLDKVDFNPDLEYLAFRAIGWGAWFLVIVWLVGQLGQDEIFATLIAGGTLVGLAVALAVKDSLSDVVGGVLLLGDKHFDLGDTIKVGSTEGEIIEVDLRKTRVKTKDGSIVIIPNAKIDNGGWTLRPRAKERERLISKLKKRANAVNSISKKIISGKK